MSTSQVNDASEEELELREEVRSIKSVLKMTMMDDSIDCSPVQAIIFETIMFPSPLMLPRLLYLWAAEQCYINLSSEKNIKVCRVITYSKRNRLI